MKKIIVSILVMTNCIVLLGFYDIKVSASSYESKNIEKMSELVYDIENQLQKDGTDVKKELRKLATELKKQERNVHNISNELLNRGKKEQIRSLEKTLDEMIHIYDTKKSTMITGGIEDVCRAAVIAIIGWFSSNDYLLSAELLSHAWDNNDIDSYYSPAFGIRIEASPVFWACRNNTALTTGTAGM